VSKTVVEKLKAENALLRDLLETQYRETDKARAESDKADDEALEYKLEAARLRMLGTRVEYQLVWELKRRLEKATKKATT
jgi:hypothetical protein